MSWSLSMQQFQGKIVASQDKQAFCDFSMDQLQEGECS